MQSEIDREKYVAEIEAKLKRAEEALRFYAKGGHIPDFIGDDGYCDVVENGDTARDALADIRGDRPATPAKVSDEDEFECAPLITQVKLKMTDNGE